MMSLISSENSRMPLPFSSAVSIGKMVERKTLLRSSDLDACIAHLKNENFVLYPDFPTGGMIDVSKYNDERNSG